MLIIWLVCIIFDTDISFSELLAFLAEEIQAAEAAGRILMAQSLKYFQRIFLLKWSEI